MSCCGARVIVEPSAGTSGSNFPGGIFTSSIVGLSSINGVSYSGGGGGSNFTAGITFGTSDGLMSLSSFNTTTATALLQGTPGKDPSLRIGTAIDFTNIYKSGISFFDSDVGGNVNFATYGGGGAVLLSSVDTINGRSPVLDNGSNIKVTSSGNDVLDATGQAVIALPFSYKDSNSYSILVTQLSSQPTVTPWAKINDSNEFQLNGDSNATISWMCIGNP